MHFESHAPSTQWEPVSPPDLPQCGLWAWYFPPHAPAAATVSIPKTTFAQFGPELTARRLIAAVGWPVQTVASWTAFNATLDPRHGDNPALDAPFPPMPGLDIEVVIALHPEFMKDALSSAPGQAISEHKHRQPPAADDSMVLDGLDEILAAAEPVVQSNDSPASVAGTFPVASAPAMIPPGGAMPGMMPGGMVPQVAPVVGGPVAGPAVPVSALAPDGATVGGPPASSSPVASQPAAGDAASMPAATGAPVDAQAERAFASIAADWSAIETLERQLASVTKQLNGQASKLQSLNRDLTSQERLSADSNDIKDWNAVRRLLRDAAATASKQVRAFDIGTVSAAGNRNRFADIYTAYVQNRQPFDNMATIAQEFEHHRKVCQNLLTQSTAALSASQRDAEGKARAILNRIKSKARSKR